MLRRALFGLFWFAILWMALAVIGGGLADSMAPVHSAATAEQVQGGQSRKPGTGAAAQGFHERYGMIVLASAALLALGGTLAGILPGTKR